MLTNQKPIEILHLFRSSGHNFLGHHGQAAGEHPVEEIPLAELVAGRGITGDRFFDHKPDFKGQITFFDMDVWLDLLSSLGLPASSRHISVTRRNVITRGLDLQACIGAEFSLQGVRMEGVEECRPCHWMDAVIAPGAELGLRGRGGLRARIMSSGSLRIGPALGNRP